MRKFIDIVLITIFFIIGFTGIKWKVNSNEVKIKPFIKDMFVKKCGDDTVKGSLDFNDDLFRLY